MTAEQPLPSPPLPRPAHVGEQAGGEVSDAWNMSHLAMVESSSDAVRAKLQTNLQVGDYLRLDLWLRKSGYPFVTEKHRQPLNSPATNRILNEFLVNTTKSYKQVFFRGSKSE